MDTLNRAYKAPNSSKSYINVHCEAQHSLGSIWGFAKDDRRCRRGENLLKHVTYVKARMSPSNAANNMGLSRHYSKPNQRLLGCRKAAFEEETLCHGIESQVSEVTGGF